MRSHSTNLPGRRFAAWYEYKMDQDVLFVPKEASSDLAVGSSKTIELDVGQTPGGISSSTVSWVAARALPNQPSEQTVLTCRYDDQDEKPYNWDEWKVKDLAKDEDCIQEMISDASLTRQQEGEAWTLIREFNAWFGPHPSTTVKHHHKEPPSKVTLKRIE